MSKNNHKKIWCDECGIVAVEHEFGVCATCSSEFRWNGKCLSCQEHQPQQPGCVYCNECIAELAGISFENACRDCFGQEAQAGSIYCGTCNEALEADAKDWNTSFYDDSESVWGMPDDEYYWNGYYGYGFEHLEREQPIPSVEEELETFARAS